MDLDGLLKIAKQNRRIVPVKVGDETVYLRGLSAAEADDASERCDEDSPYLVRAVLVATALCDQDGNPLCGDVLPYAKQLADLPAGLLARLTRAMDEASDVPAGGSEKLVGNSEPKGGRFAGRLAGHLKLASIDGMLQAMTAKDYLRWTEQYRIEPFGDMAASLRNWLYASATVDAEMKQDWFHPGEQTPQEIEEQKRLEAVQDDFRLMRAEIRKGTQPDGGNAR